MRLLLRNFFSSGLVQNTLLLFLLCFYFPLRSCATLASVCIKSQESSNPAGFQLYFSGYRAVTDRDGFATFQLNDFDNEKKISLLISNGVLWDDSYFSKTKKQAERFISVVRKKKISFFPNELS
jgi:hypothetical protein